jgi:hypothetical protein
MNGLRSDDPGCSPDHGVFLTWNDSRRSISLARELDIARVVQCAGRRGIARHLLATLQTIAYLARVHPGRIWYQFSFLLGVVLAGYALLRRRQPVVLVADVHTKALRREGPWWLAPVVRRAKAKALHACRTTLVSNRANAEWAQSRYGLTPNVLPDPLPTVPEPSPSAFRSADVVFICSFAADEPVDLITRVAEALAPHWRVAVTGDPQPLESSARAALQAVTGLTGFLSEEAYWALLRTARCIVVLSTEPDCVPCGAYEAIAVGCRPVVALNPSVQAVFGDGAIYSELHLGTLVAIIDAAARTGGSDAGLPQRYRQSWQLSWVNLFNDLGDIGP